MKILAGDIGGTHARLALFEVKVGQFQILSQKTYSSVDYVSLDDIVVEFLEQTNADCNAVCFGVASPIKNQICRIINLPWLVDAVAIKARLGLDRVWLINDLEATAWGIADLGQNDFCTLQKGDAGNLGNRCVIAAGTGLGEVGLYLNGTDYHPFATEGGHTGFAPCNALEFDLFEYLAKDFGHVSWERLLSGPGLVSIYRFLHKHHGEVLPEWLAEAEHMGHEAAVISQAALKETCSISIEALELFVTFYGVEAGNLALKNMATGGVFIGGGIAPKILPKLQEGAFLRAFNAKGRMESLLQTMPVKVILDNNIALYGSARYAEMQQMKQP